MALSTTPIRIGEKKQSKEHLLWIPSPVPWAYVGVILLPARKASWMYLTSVIPSVVCGGRVLPPLKIGVRCGGGGGVEICLRRRGCAAAQTHS